VGVQIQHPGQDGVEGGIALLSPCQPIERHQVLKIGALAGVPPPHEATKVVFLPGADMQRVCQLQ